MLFREGAKTRVRVEFRNDDRDFHSDGRRFHGDGTATIAKIAATVAKIAAKVQRRSSDGGATVMGRLRSGLSRWRCFTIFDAHPSLQLSERLNPIGPPTNAVKHGRGSSDGRENRSDGRENRGDGRENRGESAVPGQRRRNDGDG